MPPAHHCRPTFSQTVLVPHMYQNPMSQLVAQPGAFQPDEKKIQSEASLESEQCRPHWLAVSATIAN